MKKDDKNIVGALLSKEINTPVGKFILTFDDDAVISIYAERFSDRTDKTAINGENAISQQAERELEEYFSGKRQEFTVPLRPIGTEFQQKVWNALLEIPYGETCTYKDIAESVDNPKGYRAVGMANNRNPLMIFIPCHRVIGADGSLTGYGGGMSVKEALLELERKYK